MRKLLQRIVAAGVPLVVALFAFAGTAVAAPGSTNEGAANLCNLSPNANSTIGVIHTPDGSYVHGNYDALISGIGASVRCTQQLGWPHAGGFYVPPRVAILIYDSLGRLLLRYPQTDHVSPAWFFPDNAAGKYNLQNCVFTSNSTCNIQ